MSLTFIIKCINIISRQFYNLGFIIQIIYCMYKFIYDKEIKINFQSQDGIIVLNLSQVQDERQLFLYIINLKFIPMLNLVYIFLKIERLHFIAILQIPVNHAKMLLNPIVAYIFSWNFLVQMIIYYFSQNACYSDSPVYFSL